MSVLKQIQEFILQVLLYSLITSSIWVINLLITVGDFISNDKEKSNPDNKKFIGNMLV
jgi:hypothetical protein